MIVIMPSTEEMNEFMESINSEIRFKAGDNVLPSILIAMNELKNYIDAKTEKTND